MNTDHTEVLGVRVDNLSTSEIREKILLSLEKFPKQTFVTTLNPEILLKAHWDSSYRDILNKGDINLCDGFGLKLVSYLRGKSIKARMAGAALVDFILKQANSRALRVLVVSVENSLSTPSEIERSLKEKYPRLFAKAEYFSGSQDLFKNDIIKQTDIVFVNFGAPAQEKFISENREKFPKARILIGIGGAFDFITGRVRRAPRLCQSIGMEWLWRFIQEPKRLRRIVNAVIIFPFLALTQKS